MKSALITGVTGQDGYYLAEFLLAEGYAVHGLVRFTSSMDADVPAGVVVHHGDVADSSSVRDAIDATVAANPLGRIEIYSLAAQTHVGMSFDCPRATFETNITCILNILDHVVSAGVGGRCRVYQASTSELYGRVHETPQTEETPFHPRSPYGVSKLCAHWIVRNYRETHGLFACCGILFNHESPRRGAQFVTQKIVRHAVDGIPVRLGNLDARRDWGHAKDYVRAMWMMLQCDRPDEYVVSSGRATSVREFCSMVYAKLGKTVEWRGAGLDEVGVVDGKVVVAVDARFFRPCEVDFLIGDCSKIKRLGWAPEYDLGALVDDMIRARCSPGRSCRPA